MSKYLVYKELRERMFKGEIDGKELTQEMKRLEAKQIDLGLSTNIFPDENDKDKSRKEEQ